ncbi:GNAT family N-acetyltransferase [Galbibacter sp. BG1]|uniref:GNAT family N-acetyltransferase n=1 Tax=Galbibacter sp. BG1 TaxID=1170699 RepID=UPI0015B85083|nr:GNAT family N-acetyltransferase [Galbibacter sp. BG1]QLE01885.1 GNAT family N-acetyltransferase [Galbibacter sp. BG1]
MYKVREISAEEAHSVRHPVLRKGKPFDSAIFPEDSLKDTFHVGVVIDDVVAGTVTFIKNSNDNFKEKAQYQLRGMAVSEEYQRKGIGEVMVKKAETLMLERGGKFIWLNAREVAVLFYEKMGYEKYGKSFLVPGIGKHFVMIKKML